MQALPEGPMSCSKFNAYGDNRSGARGFSLRAADHCFTHRDCALVGQNVAHMGNCRPLWLQVIRSSIVQSAKQARQGVKT